MIAALEADVNDHGNPDVVDARLLALSKCQSGLDLEIGEWLLAADRLHIHESFGFASIYEYALRRFGWDGRTTRDRLRVAEALEKLPATRERLADGRFVWSVVRELTRVLREPEDEPDWMVAAANKTARQVERLVKHKKPRAKPTDPDQPELEEYPIL